MKKHCEGVLQNDYNTQHTTGGVKTINTSRTWCLLHRVLQEGKKIICVKDIATCVIFAILVPNVLTISPPSRSLMLTGSDAGSRKTNATRA